MADPSPSVPLEAISLQDALAKAYQIVPIFRPPRHKLRPQNSRYAPRKLNAIPHCRLRVSIAMKVFGFLVTNSHGVFEATGSIQFNIFDGGRIKADILQNDADLVQKPPQRSPNLRGQIDYEVRTALLDLKSAGDQVDVAHSNVDLANQTLRQARDRFAAGVTNTVEVVQAQQSVADADENLISAQYQYNVAEVFARPVSWISRRGYSDILQQATLNVLLLFQIETADEQGVNS